MDSSLYGSYVYLVHTSDLNLTSCIERTSVRVSGETAHTCFIHWPDDLGSCAPLHGRRCCPYGGRCELCWSPWIHQLGPTSYWHRRIPWQRLAPGRYSVHCRNTDTQREKIIIHQVPTDKQFDLTVKLAFQPSWQFPQKHVVLMPTRGTRELWFLCFALWSKPFRLNTCCIKLIIAWRMFWTVIIGTMVMQQVCSQAMWEYSLLCQNYHYDILQWKPWWLFPSLIRHPFEVKLSLWYFFSCNYTATVFVSLISKLLFVL